MRSAQFIKSATRRSQYPRSKLRQVAFAGRSNVGKSSLLNCLIGRKGLAKTSSTPGRTQLINFFSVEDELMLVDLPGYGFAKVPAQVRAQWAGMIEEFLQNNDRLDLVVAIVDARHRPSNLDAQLIEWLRYFEVPFQVVATKIDKLSGNQRSGNISQIEAGLGVHEVLPFSAVTGQGKKELWRIIKESRSKSVPL